MIEKIDRNIKKNIFSPLVKPKDRWWYKKHREQHFGENLLKERLFILKFNYGIRTLFLNYSDCWDKKYLPFCDKIAITSQNKWKLIKEEARNYENAKS